MLTTPRVIQNLFLQRISYSIVQTFKKHRRSMFDFTDYNENWLPRIKPYHKSRKPRQAAWSDPNVEYPQIIPPLHPGMKPKEYLRSIEQEEKQKIQCKRDFLVGDIRAGDIVEITYQETFESEDVVKYKALVIAMTKRNSLMAGMVVIVRLAGINIQAHYPIHSPKIKNIDLVSRGSGTHKSRMYYLFENSKLTKTSVVTPMRNKSSSRRKDDLFQESGQNTKVKNLITDEVTDKKDN